MAKKKPEVKHTTIRNSNLFCLNCGGSHILVYPLGAETLSQLVGAFNTLHANCKPIWKEPEPDMYDSVLQRAKWWMAHGEQGSSSKTMWNFFMRTKDFEISHPYDPDDFSRCYKLLKAIPEWGRHLTEMQDLSPAWKNLVDNWSRLTAMYEENLRTGWRRAEEIGMYEFMQTLINPVKV